MKRDPRLRGLSAEHHHALVLARRMARLAAGDAVDAGDAAAVGARFDRELEPHFRTEEELLLPALRAAGEAALAARTEADHAALRAAMAAARAGDGAALREFAARLEEHVRFEERELFPRCEERLADDVLDAVARRAPARG
jgi:hemerythrin-like domain-containing protein